MSKYYRNCHDGYKLKSRLAKKKHPKQLGQAPVLLLNVDGTKTVIPAKVWRESKASLAANPQNFYESREWKELRYRVLEKFGARCMACGRTPREHSIAIHVDHIKPISKFPLLALDMSNLQVFCSDCNIGKSNKTFTDWRNISGSKANE